ncbi:4-hydroxyphenylacetate 3-monooxygenase reductase component [Providencia rustigianii]|nr:4-hydroxyphenylacetate 3-monooxygenase reductase component [Providencia rustigianii]
MSLENEHRLRFRDAMASLGAAVNIVTTDGTEGRCGINGDCGLFSDRYATHFDGMREPQQCDECGFSKEWPPVR